MGFKAFWLLLPVVCTANAPFLKEIVQGRCLFNSPTGDANDCPTLVDNVVGVLESNLDSRINEDNFHVFLDAVDLTTEADKAAIFLTSFAHQTKKLKVDQSEFIWDMNLPPGLITPESTPGGALMKDLVFCGVDQAEDCNLEDSRAYWIFWKALYRKFASGVRGKLQIVIQPYADVDFLKEAIANHLQREHVTEVTLYGEDCTSFTMKRAMNHFQSNGFESVNCSDDLVQLQLCGGAGAKTLQCSTYLSCGCSEDAFVKQKEEAWSTAKQYAGQPIERDGDHQELRPRHRHHNHHVLLYFLFLVGFLYMIINYMHLFSGTLEGYNGKLLSEEYPIREGNDIHITYSDAPRFQSGSLGQDDMETVVL